jgi:hypothetical protein
MNKSKMECSIGLQSCIPKELLMNGARLHQKIMQEFGRIGMTVRQSQQVNHALWCQGLASSDNCHLTNLALGLPIEAERESLVQRLHRSLKDGIYSASGCNALAGARSFQADR